MFNMTMRLNDSFRTELEPAEYNRRQGKAIKGIRGRHRSIRSQIFRIGRGEAQQRRDTSVAAE